MGHRRLLRLRVCGMTCGRCERIIHEAIGEMDGVRSGGGKQHDLQNRGSQLVTQLCDPLCNPTPMSISQPAL